MSGVTMMIYSVKLSMISKVNNFSTRLEKCVWCVLVLYNWDLHVFFFWADIIMTSYSTCEIHNKAA